MSGRRREERKSSGTRRTSPPVETRDTQSDDSSDTEPLKRGSQKMKSSEVSGNKNEVTVDLNGTTETDITDDSPRTDTEEGSIAVDCPHGPTEVIVQGKNVRKIRVKFPPHPPPLSMEAMMPKPPSGRLRKRGSETSLKSKGSPTYEVPLSQEETPGSDPGTIWPTSISSSVTATSGVSNACAAVDALSHRSSYGPGSNYDFGLHVGNIDMDKKFQHDMTNGMEYFQNRTDDLKSANTRMVHEIERLVALNAELEGRFRDGDARYQSLVGEHDELKIRLDEMTKEKMQLEEQAVGQWQGRVKVEEMYTEMKRESDLELRSVRQELKDVKFQQPDGGKVVGPGGSEGAVRKTSVQKTKSLDANAMELLRKLATLQDQLAKLQMDKAMGQDANRKLDKELGDYKRMYKDKSRELDAQYKRFLSLKKSFNDLTDEHEKLKTALRGRGIAALNTSGSGNSTWPSQKVETVRLVDISAKVSGAVSAAATPSYMASSQKTPKPIRSKVMTHKRNTSDGLASIANDKNLPPVTTVAK